MTSPLSPRDIQTRIRSGASLEEVAHEAGVPVEKVEPFAAPVLAEREHVAGTALQCPVRRRGETGSVRSMRSVATDKLAPHGVVVDEEDWDAWRNEDRRWTVQGSYQLEGERRVARFIFDQRARFSVAQNDEARWLIGEVTASQPVTSPDAEPTIDLNDELALIRAVQGAVPVVDSPPSPAEPVRPTAVPEPANTEVAPEPQDSDEAEVEDYAPAEFEEVDGVYDFVPKNTSDMDVLYDMLSSFAEDSVNIYAGLTNPVTQDVPEPVDAGLDEAEVEPEPTPMPEPAAGTAEVASTGSAAEVRPAAQTEPDLTAVVDVPEEAPVARPAEGVVVEVDLPASEVTSTGSADVAESASEVTSTGSADVAESVSEVTSTGSADVAESVSEVTSTSSADVAESPEPAAADDADQEPLVESAAPAPAPKPKPKPRSRKKRASVPSWDEIMFGGPTTKKD